MNTPRAIIMTCCTALCGTTALASTITQNSPTPTIGIPYRWLVQMNGSDSAAVSRHVGAWSWEDESLGAPNVGWTHESDWLALVLTAAATLTVRIERDANVPQPIAGDPGHLASVASMFPSFTVWAGVDQDDPLAHNSHSYNNRGNVAWAEDVSYLDHVDNFAQTFVEESWVLAAGSYTFAMGSNSPATDPERQGYRTILTTTAVPEPGTVSFVALGAWMLAKRRFRTARLRVFRCVNLRPARGNVTVLLPQRRNITLDYRTPIRQNRCNSQPPCNHENDTHTPAVTRRGGLRPRGHCSV